MQLVHERAPSSSDFEMVAIAGTMVGVALVAWALTGYVRRYALSRKLLDIPNERSSHITATPRGGGLAIVVAVLLVVAGRLFSGRGDPELGIAMLGGGIIVALIGWWDDQRHVAPRWRLVAQFAAAAWAVYWIGAPELGWLGESVPGVVSVASVAATVGLVWLLNLFNFMDGIDGIAAGVTTLVGGIGGAWLAASGSTDGGVTAFVLSAACAGFLVWNWPPAKIFMGDAGSGFIGYGIGVVALHGVESDVVPVPIWLLVLGVFVFDATVTLIRRLGRERVYEAHRRHAYQRAVRAGWSHRFVTSAALGLTAMLGVVATGAWLVPRLTWIALAAGGGALAGVYILVERRYPMWQDSERSH